MLASSDLRYYVTGCKEMELPYDLQWMQVYEAIREPPE